jgi:hypothetical protein
MMGPPTTKPVGTPVDEALAHAQFHARTGVSEIGSTVIRSGFKDSGHFWDCVVTDGREWHYIRVLGPGLEPFASFSSEDIESGIDRFAATLPSEGRLRALLNANPLHIDSSGEISD